MRHAILRRLLMFTLLADSSAVIADPYTVFGASDCGQWVNEASGPRKAWLMGFLSGMSAMDSIDRLARKATVSHDPLDALNSAQQAFLWMDNYCRTNPLKNVGDGGTALYIELMRKSLPSR